MSLDVALEALTLGCAAYVDLVAYSEHIGDLDLLAQAVILIRLELADDPLDLHVSLLELSCVRLVDELSTYRTCTYLASLVTVSLNRLVLEHVHRLALDNGCGNYVTVLVEQLRHS